MTEHWASARTVTSGPFAGTTQVNVHTWNGEVARQEHVYYTAYDSLPAIDNSLTFRGYQRVGLWHRVGSSEFAKVEIITEDIFLARRYKDKS